MIQNEQWDQVVEWGEQWILLGYAPEPAFRYLMQAHAGLGNLGMVNTTYQRCVESLNRELNLEPPQETQQLYEHIRVGVDELSIKVNAEQLIELSHKIGIKGWLGDGIMSQGEALAMMGKFREGFEQMHTGIAVHESIGLRCNLPGTLRAIAAAQAKAGQSDDALTTLDKALVMVKETSEGFWEAELHRLRGDLLFMHWEAEAEAEFSLLKALEVTRQQKTKSWELQAATDLARLWQTQGRTDEAQEMLAPLYEWFTEGFDTPDLKAAQALLEELSSVRRI